MKKNTSEKQRKSYANRVETAKALAKFLEGETFVIDRKPPAPLTRQVSQEHLLFRQKIKATAEKTHVGMAMIVPAIGAKIAREFLKTEMPEYKFTINTIVGNDKECRIYKLKYPKENGTK